jgi:hypothetical protein
MLQNLPVEIADVCSTLTIALSPPRAPPTGKTPKLMLSKKSLESVRFRRKAAHTHA